MAPSRGIDSILLEVLWNRLVAVVNEQAAALMRTSFTSIVRESGDLSAGVFDPMGRMMAQAVTGTPGHINSMATCIHYFLAEYPPESLRPGDVLITNDPWKTSGHLHDLTVITPVFRDGALVAFFGNTCHAIDIGGRGYGADATEVYEEGLFIPITKSCSSSSERTSGCPTRCSETSTRR
jgi:N-methylhydantoinase B